MAKKTKKKNPQQVKEEYVLMRREYFRKLRKALSVMGDTSGFEKLTEQNKFLLYNARYRPVKFVPANNAPFSQKTKVLSAFSRTFTTMLQNEFIEIGVDKVRVSVYDFIVYIESFAAVYRSLDDEEIKLPFAKSDFPGYSCAYEETQDEVIETLREKIMLLGLYYSVMNHFRVWFELKETPEIDDSSEVVDLSVLAPTYIVHIDIPEAEMLTIDGKPRPIFRLAFYVDEVMCFVSVTLKQLGNEGLMSDLPLGVYLQNHVVYRVAERLGLNSLPIVSINIISSFVNPEVCRSDDGSYLIALIADEVRLGYFKANVIDGKLLIRTFLFLTNNGTPEGKKLSALLRVSKEDKKYLGIDMLETFINSDIDKNERLRDVFVQAGCESLFRASALFINVNSVGQNIADGIVSYLDLDKKTEEEQAIANIDYALLMDELQR